PQSAPPVSNAEGNPGLMVYTSGTTGKPKGALRDLKKTGIGQVFAFMSKLPISHEDRHLAVCPLYHSAAPAFVMLTFLVGGTVVVADHFDPEEVLKTIEFERITSTMMVPTMYSRIVNLPRETLRKYDVSSLRWLMSGAAPLPTALAGKIEDTLGQILYNFYGATETGFVTIAPPREHPAARHHRPRRRRQRHQVPGRSGLRGGRGPGRRAVGRQLDAHQRLLPQRRRHQEMQARRLFHGRRSRPPRRGRLHLSGRSQDR